MFIGHRLPPAPVCGRAGPVRRRRLGGGARRGPRAPTRPAPPSPRGGGGGSDSSGMGDTLEEPWWESPSGAGSTPGTRLLELASHAGIKQSS